MSHNIDDSLADASLSTLVGAGCALGLVHVITGPDHLGALMVLSTGSSWRSFQLGMYWGTGHSTSLLLLTTVFLLVHQRLNLSTLGTVCDAIVGGLMILLGAWSLCYFSRLRRQHKSRQLIIDLQEQRVAAVDVSPLPTPDILFFQHDDGVHSILERGRSSPEPESLSTFALKPSFDESLVTRKCCFGMCNMPSADIRNPYTTHFTAFAYGIAHGLAGTGGVLGVLPAVVLNNWGRSFAYLLSFCVASIFIMGVFSALYGEVTGRIVRQSDKLEYRVGIFSSAISLVIGVMWIVLLATGSMDAIL
ncbi:hypothetical protein ATCC90586_007607 [Pythium insidiosum]|nr:hypothetical protein ATCC90586_007607 [Pythium insidiosum]